MGRPLLSAVFCSLFLLFLGFLFHPTPGLADGTILIYHRFGEDEYPTTNVPLDRFQAQLDYLAANHYRVVPLAELVAAVEAGRAVPDRTVAITVDDGYRSTYTVAWPLLRARGWPFTLFLYTGAVERGYRNFLTWSQVQEMAAAGVDVQDHGYGHARFGRRPPGGDDPAWQAAVRRDLQRSRALLTRHLGRPPRFLAYPYGEYNDLVIGVARELGYQAAFSQDPGAVGPQAERFFLPREPILGREWSTVDHLATVLARKDLPITGRVPDITPLQPAAVTLFAARLARPGAYLPNTLALYVSEFGWLPARLEGEWLRAVPPGPLTRRQNRVAVRGVERAGGRTAVRFWLLIDPAQPVEEER